MKEKAKKEELKSKPKDVNLNDIVKGKSDMESSKNDEMFKELNLPGGKTTKGATSSAAAAAAGSSSNA